MMMLLAHFADEPSPAFAFHDTKSIGGKFPGPRPKQAVGAA
jgi:hypothetical protein